LTTHANYFTVLDYVQERVDWVGIIVIISVARCFFDEVFPFSFTYSGGPWFSLFSSIACKNNLK
jgi:hypothetical protein